MFLQPIAHLIFARREFGDARKLAFEKMVKNAQHGHPLRRKSGPPAYLFALAKVDAPEWD